MKAVIILMIVGASSAQYLFGNNPLWNAGAVHHDPLWAVRSAAPHWVPQDTPEVQAAKAQHFAAHAEALARSGRKKRGVLATAYAAPVVHTAYAAPVVHTAYAAPVLRTAYSAPLVHTAYASPVLRTAYASPLVRAW